MEKRCPKTIFWLSEKPYKPPKTAKQEAFRWLRDAEAAGSSPVTSTTPEQSSLCSGLFFYLRQKKSHPPVLLLLLSVKGLARLTCPTVNGSATVRCRCQPFAVKSPTAKNSGVSFLLPLDNKQHQRTEAQMVSDFYINFESKNQKIIYFFCPLKHA